jgi:DNA-binding response OmpR family regulator
MSITKVLIVDDSKTELMFLTDLLQKNGFTVRTAKMQMRRSSDWRKRSRS